MNEKAELERLKKLLMEKQIEVLACDIQKEELEKYSDCKGCQQLQRRLTEEHNLYGEIVDFAQYVEHCIGATTREPWDDDELITITITGAAANQLYAALAKTEDGEEDA